MPEFISDEAFSDLFNSFEHTAWRLETQRGYDADQSTEKYQRFLRGEDPGRKPDDPWYVTMREQTAQGKRVERVRLVDEPATTGQQFLLTGAPYNIAAGEDIRYMFRSQAQRLGLPMVDFWIFDSRTVARFSFKDDRCLGIELATDPAEVLACCQVRDAAWHHATRYADFKARVPSTV